MKKSANTIIYCNYIPKMDTDFFAVSVTTFRGKSDFIAMCSQINYSFQEKLPIIYANIRV